MSGLGDLLGGADEAAGRSVGGETLDGSPFDAVHTRVRRAHARRSAIRAGIVGLVVVLAVVARFYGVSGLGGAMSAADAGGTAAASAADSPSASPSVSPTASPTAVAWPG